VRIAVIGAGTVGGTLGRGWARRGHEVTFGVRDESGPRATGLASEGLRVAAPRMAVEGSEAVLLATPWAAAREALAGLGDLGGRPLLDATNPIGPGLTLALGHHTSGGEQVQAWARGARVVKVFNTTGAENLAAPRFGERAALMLYCGDDASACAVAARLATDLGFEAVAAGPLASARLIEPLALLWIRLAMAEGQGRDFAFGLLRRGRAGVGQAPA